MLARAEEPGGQEIGPQLERGLQARNGVRGPAGHGERHPVVEQHAGLGVRFRVCVARHGG